MTSSCCSFGSYDQQTQLCVGTLLLQLVILCYFRIKTSCVRTVFFYNWHLISLKTNCNFHEHSETDSSYTSVNGDRDNLLTEILNLPQTFLFYLGLMPMTHRASLKMYLYKLQNILHPQFPLNTCHIHLNMCQTTVQTNK